MAGPSASESVIAGSGTKVAIRDAAVKLFGNKGFDQTSLREVADAVGITKASLYYHYPSKLDLLMAIIDPIVDHMRSVVNDIDAVPYDADGVRTVLRNYLRGLLRHRNAGALCVRDTVAVFNAMGDRFPDLLDTSQKLREWLGGPDPTDEARVRAAAALEVLGVALASDEFMPGVPEELLERTLLDAATCVLTACGTT
ncbi:TetR/AcrR family transcriptional regulator [Nocardia puris]|uniref:TetR/AcrR family transcriptional regulator n=1 Tax=Nocardia puris TaxID=208602 RepID=UPI00189482C5|nr:TetR/AcrR family transcriptional regulator [Nocardia puris]MBF6213839.1 TetR/AcrR family transcriptional regulator [Nocardia puris]MBF6368478.1 TetR/AcrR family transcriptional regulator [Nocardia puris]MBF6462965.1 TetR/AcrR family transcriptional regulator [Nocardia puris]